MGIAIMQGCSKGRLPKNKAQIPAGHVCDKTRLPVFSPPTKFMDKSSVRVNIAG
jgi:hypothetical protein